MNESGERRPSEYLSCIHKYIWRTFDIQYDISAQYAICSRRQENWGETFGKNRFHPRRFRWADDRSNRSDDERHNFRREREDTKREKGRVRGKGDSCCILSIHWSSISQDAFTSTRFFFFFFFFPFLQFCVDGLCFSSSLVYMSQTVLNTGTIRREPMSVG